jgi:hypothetical protein
MGDQWQSPGSGHDQNQAHTQQQHQGQQPQRLVGSLVGGQPADVLFAGRPIDYESRTYTFEQSWNLLSPELRTWALECAGPPMSDPHTGVATDYWYCDVRPSSGAGQGVQTSGARYELMRFGGRGLVVSSGTTDWLGGPDGQTTWDDTDRSFDLAVEPTSLRHDHRRDAVPNTSGGSRLRGKLLGQASTPVEAILPTHIADMFGNLPVATQRFLLTPFTTHRGRPLQPGLYATTEVVGSSYRESYWLHLFDLDRMAFSMAWHEVPLRSGLTGPALWNDSPESKALQQAPWTVAAWTATLARPGRIVARTAAAQ